MTQRPIKFRAWCKSEPNKGMYYPIVLQMANGKFDRLWTNDYKLSSDVDDVVLMQFTGLLDKNGVLIYEGDVLGYSRKDNDRDWNVEGRKAFPVIFENGQYFVNFRKYKISEWKEPLYEVVKNNQNRKIFMEVIGNIYENPELLN